MKHCDSYVKYYNWLKMRFGYIWNVFVAILPWWYSKSLVLPGERLILDSYWEDCISEMPNLKRLLIISNGNKIVCCQYYPILSANWFISHLSSVLGMLTIPFCYSFLQKKNISIILESLSTSSCDKTAFILFEKHTRILDNAA